MFLVPQTFVLLRRQGKDDLSTGSTLGDCTDGLYRSRVHASGPGYPVRSEYKANIFSLWKQIFICIEFSL